MKNKRKSFELLLIVLCFILAVIVFLHLHSMSRSIALITIGIFVLYISYKIVKEIQRYKIRSFAEIIDNVLASGWNKQLIALSFVTAVAFLLSWALISSMETLHWDGDDQHLNSNQSFWLTLCYFFDPGNLNLTDHREPGAQGLISFVVALLGMTILTGLLISTFTNILEQRVTSVQKGLTTYKNIKGHSVVIGFCELTESVIRGILEMSEAERKVILLTNCDMDEVRKSMYNLTHYHDYDGQIVIYSGNYQYNENLERLNLAQSKSVYVLGDDGVVSRDFENIACAQRISSIVFAKREMKVISTPIPMYVRMDRMPTFSTLQRLDIKSGFFASDVYFRPFNYYEHWTRQMWVKGCIDLCDTVGKRTHIDYPSLVFDKASDEKFIHLVVSGFSQMGMAVVLYALRAAHYGNYTEQNNRKTVITVVDPEISTLRPQFESQYQHLEQIYDVQIEYRPFLLEELRDELKLWCCDTKQMLTIAICLGDTDMALSQSLNLPLEAYYQLGRSSDTMPRILVRQRSLSGIWQMLREREHEELIDKEISAKDYRNGTYNKYHNLYPFGMMVSGFYPSDMDDLKACLIHVDYEDQWLYGDKPEDRKITIARMYQLVKKCDNITIEKLVGEALKRWHVMSENVKWANRYQSDNHHILKDVLQSKGITSLEDLQSLENLPLAKCSDIEHRRWLGERVVSGWQQSPFMLDGKPMRQNSLLLHYDITETSKIGSEAAKDNNVVRNVLMLDTIFEYIKTNLHLEAQA